MTGGTRPPGEYGDGKFNPAYALETMISDLAAAVLGASRHAASRMTTDGLERTLLWLGDTPDLDFGKAGGNAAAVLHLTRGLFRELTQRCRRGDLPACWQPAIELSDLPDPLCGQHGPMTSRGAVLDPPSRTWECGQCGMRADAWITDDGQPRWTATGATGLVRFPETPPAATTAGIGGRSTPPKFADCATVFDARGEQWVYSQPSDTWCLRPGLAEPVSLTSARSWQRLLAEYGPLKEPTGGTHR